MKKTTENGYNPHLSNLIRYGDKTYASLRGFIEENLWDKLDDDLLGKIALILDDPKHEYDKDLTMTKKLLGHFLPILKERLGINLDNPVTKKIISEQIVIDKNKKITKEKISTTTNPIILDRYIQEQLDIYHANESMSLLQALSQNKDDKVASDSMVAHSMQTRKSIIADIMSFMLLEDEHKKHNDKSTAKKITHKFK